MSWDGTSAGWRAHLGALEALPVETGSRKSINEALAPGFYVSAMNGALKALVDGPYAHHAEALVRVWAVSRAWGNVDPRACWYAWGTAQVHPETGR
jgi:hypothetical protein